MLRVGLNGGRRDSHALAQIGSPEILAVDRDGGVRRNGVRVQGAIAKPQNDGVGRNNALDGAVDLGDVVDGGRLDALDVNLGDLGAGAEVSGGGGGAVDGDFFIGGQAQKAQATVAIAKDYIVS
jgi:hypothetical protein